MDAFENKVIIDLSSDENNSSVVAPGLSDCRSSL